MATQKAKYMIAAMSTSVALAIAIFAFQALANSNDGQTKLRVDHGTHVATRDIETSKPTHDELKEFSYTQLHMAMPMKITVWSASEAQAKKASKRAFARAAELIKIFSDYDDSSEVSRLLRAKIGTPTSVSDELMAVLRFSDQLYHSTSGSFDPTAGPVVRLWRRARKESILPEPNTIAKALQKVGFDKLQLDPKQKTVTILHPGVELDFGGVAKGYIGDQVIAVILAHGISSSYYRAGGDIVLGHAPPNSNGWKIEIGKNDDGSPQTLVLKDCAISTSGDSQQFIELDGVRYSHVVDPRTGLGVTTGKTSFVIAPTGMQSDALATAGCILSDEEFQKVLQEHKNTTGWTTPP